MNTKDLLIGLGAGLLLGAVLTGVLTNRASGIFRTGERFVIHEAHWTVNRENIDLVKLEKATGATWGLTLICAGALAISGEHRGE